MKLDYRNLLQLLFPLSDDEQIIFNLHGNYLADTSSVQTIDNVDILSSFKNSQVRAAIHLTKFHNHTKAKSLLANLLTTYISTSQQKEITIIPVPLSKKRFRERGYNQVSVVVKKMLNNNSNVTLADTVLERTRHTPPQTSLKREQRLQNMRDAFGIMNQQKAVELITNKHIILLDDVMTTGATLQAAKAPLLQHSPTSITCVALAH